ncbi:hypothetical protein [Desulfosporosinus sp. Sb-LF]|uniref:hypothetical protein n=1 Tax=Desulfosporosinus sp. Sb-LF TaxID=2560027 RepID=UPI00107F7B37|nr:hypothetical protein [Desulfosporosinus sp. Sb-LF]TGE33410.1 hypothetical protein E4K68_07925 [Desulfosporosinus sp. Sb-LF]
MKSIQLKNRQTVLLRREGVKGDAARTRCPLTSNCVESDYLTFGSGEFSVSVNDEEALLEDG